MNELLKSYLFMGYCGICLYSRTDHRWLWRMRCARRIPKATNTHSEYVIFIAFPTQQWVDERASMLRLYVIWLSGLSAFVETAW